MGIIGANVVAIVALRAHVPDPDIRLNMLYHVAQVYRTIGVGQRTRVEQFTGHAEESGGETEAGKIHHAPR